MLKTQDVATGKGLNLDTHEHLLPGNSLVYMLNGDITGFENGATATFVQNVLSNSECFKYPEGYELKGAIKLDREQYMLCFKTPNSSEIGLLDTTTCAYIVKENNPCFDFQDEIMGVFKNKSGCDLRRVYFIEKNGPIRFIDIDECAPVKNIADCHDCTKEEVFDCEGYNLNKCVRFPQLNLTETTGNLPNGSYQVAMALTDNKQRFTEYYIFPQVLKFHTNNQANNRFGINVDFVTCPVGFDQYEFVLIAHRTDRATLAQRVGYFDIEQTSLIISEIDDTTYTPIDLQVIAEILPKYQSAEGIATNDETLVLKGPTVREAPDYQFKATKIRSNWVVTQVRAANAHKHMSLMRDEVYAFFIRGVYCDNERTPWYSIPSDSEQKIKARGASIWNALFNEVTNADVCSTEASCDPQVVQNWEIYDSSHITLNTGLGDYPYMFSADCEGRVVMRGDFGHWQSELQYPNNPCVWGQKDDARGEYYNPYALSCEKVRYHKMPSNKTTHIHNKRLCEEGSEDLINILGVEFSNIQPFTDNHGVPIPGIVGYEIGVADRANHKSILHKGMIYNMFEEKLADCSTSYYPNYPFNDLRPDVFLSETPAKYDSLAPFDRFAEKNYTAVTTYSRSRLQYISPDVQYERNDSGQYLQLYTEENGTLEGRYSPTEEMPSNVILSDAAILALKAITALLVLALVPSVYNIVVGSTTLVTAFRNSLAPINYAINYFAKSLYSSYRTNTIIPGNIRRSIVQSQYLLPNKVLVGTNKINNFQRESSLFLEVCDDINDPFISEFSRIRANNNACSATFSACQEIENEIPTTASYYAGIKIAKPSQYGLPDSNVIRTASSIIPWDNLAVTNTSALLLGDVHITKHKFIKKMPFFTQLPLGLPVGTVYKTRPYMNVWNTRYWLNVREQTSYMTLISVIGLLGNDDRNLNNTRDLTKRTCEEDAECSDFPVFQIDGRFYTHVIGEAHYWCESEYIGNFREFNEIQESEIERDEQLKIEYRTVQYPELFLYNQQYKWKGLHTQGLFGNIDLDCCKGEPICYSNSMAYSIKHDPLSKGDSWRKFLPNSVQFFSGQDGAFIGVRELDNNNMLLAFEDAMYTTQQDEYLDTKNGQIFLGSPDLFSRRLNKVSEDSSGFGGCIDLDSIVVTRYGVFWFDRKRKKFIGLDKGAVDVTKNMQSWFNENLVGPIKGVYDNFTENIYYTGTGKNGCGWTLSFKPKSMDWVSFHSFLPVRYLNKSDNFLSANGQGIWKHNKLYDYQRYFGTTYPFDVGFVLKDQMKQMLLQDLRVYSEWIKYEGYNCKQYNPKAFFNKMLIYNQLMSTGVRTIHLKDNNNAQHNLVQNRSDLVECTTNGDFEYRLNKFDAYETQQPLVCGGCMDYQPQDKGQAKTSNTTGNAPMKGKWFRTHLINDKVTDHKILLQLSVATNEEENI